jgi:hypothetical protein
LLNKGKNSLIKTDINGTIMAKLAIKASDKSMGVTSYTIENE